jgi:hypothetical protein
MKAATHLFSSFILGVAVWVFWLRDSDYYWDETLGSWQGPYSEAHVTRRAVPPARRATTLRLVDARP